MNRELDLLRRYMESAPRPEPGDLDGPRQRLHTEIERWATTNALTKLGADPSDSPGGRTRFKRPVIAVVSVVAALLVATAVLVPLLTHQSAHPNRTSASGHRVLESPKWRLAASITQPAWQLEPPTGGDPYEITCPSATTCYASGPTTPPSSAPGARAPQYVVEVSHDGGRTWGQSLVPTDQADFSDSTCPAENTCMISGDAPEGGAEEIVMFTTVDGGQSWTSLPIHGIGLSSALLSCATTLLCVATASEPGPGGVGVQDVSYATTDGGHTWTESALPGTFRAYALQCVSGGTCVATGQAPSTYQVTNPNGFAGAAAAIYSADGGMTWHTGLVPSSGSIISSLSCADAEHCMAIEDDSGTPVNSEVVVTDDGGASWTAARSLQPLSNNPETLSLDSISCATDSDCWVSGAELPADSTSSTPHGQGIILATEDGGQTWRSQQLPTIQGSVLTIVGSITCPTVNGCFALTNGPSSSSAFGQQLVLSNQSGPLTTSNSRTTPDRA